MCPDCKYKLPGRDGGLFFKDDKQLRQSFRLWLRWLPAPFLWWLDVRWYYGLFPFGFKLK